jgi:UDP-N-acetylglucosamine 2-epimerase (non-hydrolysing)
VTAPLAQAFVVLGTRPEAIKLFPVIRALEKAKGISVQVVITGQHRQMVDQILQPFGIQPDVDLDIMREGQSLNDIVCRVLPRLETLYSETSPSVVIVQGDTSSAFCAALAAFHRRIFVAHVEAGLRSFDRFHPYPEEANRKMISALADLHLAPTSSSAENLLREGVPRSDIVVTGNTAVDSLLEIVRNPDHIKKQCEADLQLHGDGRLILITVHRRESWADTGAVTGAGKMLPLEEIFGAIRDAALRHPGVDFVYPVHRNPKVRQPAERILGHLDNVHVLDPLAYIPFVGLMARATAILTDSGGIQEEAPSLGVPVLVLRKTTERPEGLACGSNRLVGTHSSAIQEALEEILKQTPGPPKEVPYPNPFGDGKAAARSCQAVLHLLGLGETPEEFAADPTLGR